jgi:hypothetical protein
LAWDFGAHLMDIGNFIFIFEDLYFFSQTVIRLIIISIYKQPSHFPRNNNESTLDSSHQRLGMDVV